jgi:hypothetical protein
VLTFYLQTKPLVLRHCLPRNRPGHLSWREFASPVPEIPPL